MTMSPIVLDHCHESGRFRGWICQYCNQGLGLFRESKKALLRALVYVSISELIKVYHRGLYLIGINR